MVFFSSFRLLSFYFQETPPQAFSCECCEIFRNTYFEKHLLMTASFWTRISANTDTFHAVSLIKIFLHLNIFFDCYHVKLQTNNFNLIFLSDLNHGTKLPMYFRWISAIFCCQTLLRQKYAGMMLTEILLTQCNNLK